MHIQQEDNSKLGSFYIEENGKRIAELAYTWRDNNMISIDHTEVHESLEGKGVGSQLVEHVVSFARETGIKIKVYCPFAKTVFERHKDLRDVLVS
jgi:uncharacterized protein